MDSKTYIYALTKVRTNFNGGGGGGGGLTALTPHSSILTIVD